MRRRTPVRLALILAALSLQPAVALARQGGSPNGAPNNSPNNSPNGAPAPQSRSELPSLYVRLHLLVASNADAQASKLPASLGPAVKQAQASLQLAHYRVGATFLHRCLSGANASASGVVGSLLPVATSPSVPAFYSLAMDGIQYDPDADLVRIIRFNFGLRVPVAGSAGTQYENVGIATSVRLRHGEPAIIGTIPTGRPEESLVLVAEVDRAP